MRVEPRYMYHVSLVFLKAIHRFRLLDVFLLALLFHLVQPFHKGPTPPGGYRSEVVLQGIQILYLSGCYL